MQISANEVVNQITDKLRNIYDQQEAKNIAFELLTEVYGLSRNQLILNENFVIQDEAFHQQLLSRLAQKEPVQYILGKAYFYDLPFKVSPAVLIPRPETEELVHRIIQKHQQEVDLSILDIGTGSGCIPISLKKHLPHAQVYGLDISEQALQIAKENANINEVKIHFIEADILHIENYQLPQVKVIVSNPPYVRMLEKEWMHENVLNFEPHLALFVPDSNPLIFYKKIAEMAFQKLHKNGWLYFEINEAFGTACQELVEAIGFRKVEVLKDLQNKDRMLQAQKI